MKNHYTEKENYYEMKIINNKEEEFIVIFDKEDLNIVDKFKWHIQTCKKVCKNIYYVVNRMKINGVKKTTRLHRLINNTPDELVTDHINRNTLDNRKENLKNISVHENNRNISIYTKEKYSKYKGVSYDKKRNKWRAYISINNKTTHQKRFDTEIEAAEAYNKLAIQYGHTPLNELETDK